MAPAVDDTIAVWGALARAHAVATRRMEADLVSQTGLPLARYETLAHLSSGGGRLRMSELGERAVLSTSRISRIVDELEAEGHVGRQPDPSDGRSSYAVLTTAGKAALRKATPTYEALVRKHITGHVRSTDLSAMVRGLDAVAAS